MLLTGYVAAATALPVGAINHAIKKRKAWPALGLLLPLILVPNVGFLKALYMYGLLHCFGRVFSQQSGS